MKNKWRVYINPFDGDGNYAGYQEVTDDVIFKSLGSIKFSLDNTEYDIGIFRVASLQLSLKNSQGLYSDVTQEQSIFAYKRSGSLVKITWEIDEGPYCGLPELGEEDLYLSEETTVFIGLLSDETLEQSMNDNYVTFQVLGRESIFAQVETPYSSLSDGDLFSEALFTLLNQAKITGILTINTDNILCDTDLEIDTKAFFENKTVQESLSALLLASNSVLSIVDDTVYIQPREAETTISMEFFGQGSNTGIENIISLNAIKNGLNRTFNYFTWTDTVLLSEDTTSTTKYGLRKKEVTFDFITDNSKRTTIMNSIRDEFKTPKQEFTLTTPLTYDSIALNLLDRVTVDMPRVYQSGQDVPICGIAVCGEAVFPTPLTSFYVLSTDPYKIIGRSVNIKSASIELKLRQI